MSDPWDDEFDPEPTTRAAIRWAQALGATMLGEVYDLLEQLEVSNDLPEVLGHDGTIDSVREDLEFGLDLLGADAPLSGLA